MTGKKNGNSLNSRTFFSHILHCIIITKWNFSSFPETPIRRLTILAEEKKLAFVLRYPILSNLMFHMLLFVLIYISSFESFNSFLWFVCLMSLFYYLYINIMWNVYACGKSGVDFFSFPCTFSSGKKTKNYEWFVEITGTVHKLDAEGYEYIVWMGIVSQTEYNNLIWFSCALIYTEYRMSI